MSREEVKKIFQDKNFMSDLNKVDSMEMLQQLLAKNGVQMSMSDMNTAIQKGAEVELTEDELTAVSGGLIFKWIKFAWDCFMFNPLQVH